MRSQAAPCWQPPRQQRHLQRTRFAWFRSFKKEVKQGKFVRRAWPSSSTHSAAAATPAAAPPAAPPVAPGSNFCCLKVCSGTSWESQVCLGAHLSRGHNGSSASLPKQRSSSDTSLQHMLMDATCSPLRGRRQLPADPAATAHQSAAPAHTPPSAALPALAAKTRTGTGHLHPAWPPHRAPVGAQVNRPVEIMSYVMSYVYENCLQHRTGLHLMGMFAKEALTRDWGVLPSPHKHRAQRSHARLRSRLQRGSLKSSAEARS